MFFQHFRPRFHKVSNTNRIFSPISYLCFIQQKTVQFSKTRSVISSRTSKAVILIMTLITSKIWHFCKSFRCFIPLEGTLDPRIKKWCAAKIKELGPGFSLPLHLRNLYALGIRKLPFLFYWSGWLIKTEKLLRFILMEIQGVFCSTHLNISVWIKYLALICRQLIGITLRICLSPPNIWLPNEYSSKRPNG